MIEAYFYDAEGHDERIKLTQKRLAGIGDQQLIWVDLLRKDESALRQAAEILGLPGDALTSLIVDSAEPTLESFEDRFQFSLPVSPSAPAPGGYVTYVVAEKWLFTIRDGEIPYFSAFREQNRGESLSGRLTPAALAASLLDWHLEDYQGDIADIQKLVDAIDSEVLGEREKRPPLAKLARLRLRVANLRRRLGEHRKIIHGLLRADFSHVARHPHAQHFVALERRFNRTEDALERAREMVVGSFELYATRTAQDTNQLVKTLTFVTVVIGLSGTIAGIFGMNFDTPLNKTGLTGFLAAIVVMIVLAFAIFLFARWRKWL